MVVACIAIVLFVVPMMKVNEVISTCKDSNVGDVVEFGGYEWKLLSKEDNKALLITNNCVECKQYTENFSAEGTWQSSSLREWLNNEFFDEFNKSEKAIINISIVTGNHTLNHTEYDTADKIFILSVDEAEKYFGGRGYRSLQNRWWLRTPGNGDGSNAAVVELDGNINIEGESKMNATIGVRPAMWINLES